ncbi:glycosyltransferase family 8 protein [Hymenobacter sp. BT635]|uniref:Glycosyltransferase family 8 protein n=1 Tax=Hymenobacter nitidus TaxID=2880929 RepID=A0ABS8AHA2_9BACT|nr:glycosyltransferase family 8 protein [Hymenobacter nitidus]MCB2379727.1 glycosyltransferase family 8 protein [Hymenobacter nitidus]
MHIAIAFDENYLTPVYALLTSIFENNRAESIAVHAIVTGISAAQQEELKHYARIYASDICFYALSENFATDFAIPSSLWWTPAVYYRLMFPSLLPAQVEKFIYLDTDIVVLKALRPLYDTPLDGFPIAAVRDFVDSRPDLGITAADSYFNSGVMLVDRIAWVQNDITGKCIEFIKHNPEKLKYVDQDALNAVLINKWKKLDSRFNMMLNELPAGVPLKQLLHFLRDTVVVHYTTQNKPWSMIGRNRLRDLYFNYLKKVPKKYRQRYNDFTWDRHRIREMIEIRLQELVIDYPVLSTPWRRK